LQIIFDYFIVQGRIEYWYDTDNFEIIAMDLDGGGGVVLGTIHRHPFIRSRIFTYDNSHGSGPNLSQKPWEETPNSIFDRLCTLFTQFCNNESSL